MKKLISLTLSQLDKASRRKKNVFTRQFTLFLIAYSKEGKLHNRINFTDAINWFKGK